MLNRHPYPLLWLLLFGLLILLIAASGCDEDRPDQAGDAGEARQLRAQVQAERTARLEVERLLARERSSREREHQLTEVKLDEEGRRSTLAIVAALVLTSLAAVLAVMTAREWRARRALAANIRHFLRREERYGP